MKDGSRDKRKRKMYKRGFRGTDARRRSVSEKGPEKGVIVTSDIQKD